MRRVPTGIEALDLATGGGLPLGSLILLTGEAGGGKSEFTYTFAANHSVMRSEPILLPEGVDVYLPKKFWYLTFSRKKEGILSDVQGKFTDEFYQRFSRGVLFREFLPPSTHLTMFPEWMMKRGEEEEVARRDGLLAPLAEFLKKEGVDSIMVLYTLTDIARHFKGKEIDFLTFLESLREECKGWNSIVLAILSSGILSEDIERTMNSLADCVLSFELLKRRGLEKGVSMLDCKKLRGISAKIDPFEIEFTPSGLELISHKVLAEI